ncbi:MAG TPA: hypothetical protein VF904_05560 [Anaeromyxobacteraceae bacterium]
MRTLLVPLATAATLAAAAAAQAQVAGVAGAVRSEQAALELLPQRDAAEIRTPEGFVRAEGGVAPTRATGSFGVYRAGGARAAAPPELAHGGAAQDAQAGSSAGGQASTHPCRAERGRYYRRLLESAGIDVPDPVGLLEGLAGPGGYAGAVLFSGYGLLAGLDPIRPLAWDFELRSRARDLAACVSGEASRPR